MKVLVTGATGFIGKRLVERLVVQGHEVVALVRRITPALEHPSVTVVRGSLTDPEAARRGADGCDAVVHLAVASGTSDPKVVREVNLDATRVLLDAAKAAGVGRFVFTSTISATRAKLGPYGTTKREGERMVAASGIPFVNVRPSLVYGEGGLGLFSTLTAYLKGLPVVPVIGNGRIELDPVHVDDVCAVIERCLTEPHVLGNTYDLLGPERVTFNEFLARVSRRIGVKKPVVHIPGWFALLAARGLQAVMPKPPVTVDNVIGMTVPARVDRAATARDFPLDWIRLDEGLERLERRAAALPAEAPPAPPLPPEAPGKAPAVPLLADGDGPARPVRVAIVGLGKMGVVHSAVLSMMPNVELVGLCDLQPALAKSLRGMGFRAPYHADLGALLETARPDAVWVCTPPDSHAPIARRCAEAGAAVLVEKPLAHTLGDARELDAVAAGGARMACGYVMAFYPCFAAAAHAVGHGALGTLGRVRSSMYLSQVFQPQRGWIADPGRSGGGVVANLSSHALFLLRWMFGAPVSARATWRKFFGEVEDELDGTFVLPGGAEVEFRTSWSVPGYPLSGAVVEAEGDNGRLLATNEFLELDLREGRGGWAAGRTRVRHAELPQRARFDLNGEGYWRQDAAFLAWLTGGPEPPITIRAAYDVQRMMSALYRSAAQGGSAVEVAS